MRKRVASLGVGLFLSAGWDRSAPNFPQIGHGSINLTALFNDPNDKE